MTKSTKPKFVGETLERFKRMAASGASAVEIATALNTTTNTVYVIASRKGIRLISRRGRDLGASVSGDVGAMFEARARREGVQISVLVRRILTAIANDDLFDAVLDHHDVDRQEQTTNV